MVFIYQPSSLSKEIEFMLHCIYTHKTSCPIYTASLYLSLVFYMIDTPHATAFGVYYSNLDLMAVYNLYKVYLNYTAPVVL